MQRRFYFGIVIGTLFFALNGMAQSRHFQSIDSYHHNYISGAFGFLTPGANTLSGTVNGNQQQTAFRASGLFALGGDYEYMMSNNFSLGGVLRYYNVSTTIGNNSVQDSLFALGPDARAYLQSQGFIPYVSAGFVFMAPSVTEGNNSFSIPAGIGLMLAAGVLYQLNDNVALGIETMRLTGLSNSINGNPVEDYMFKGRFAIAQ